MPNRYFDVEGRIEDLEFMAAHHETGEGAAERLGLTVEGMRKWLDRYDRLDIFQAFRQNEIRKFGCTLAELRRHDYDNRMKGIPARRAA